MVTALGIDTGGTFTDGVLIDIRTRTILAKAKARTTKEDLSKGIEECIRQLIHSRTGEIKMVALSTTLATNAVVEGRGCEVGAILIGKQPPEKLPVHHYFVVDGGHDINGFVAQDLDEEAIGEAAQSLRGKVDAVAVSSFLSIRNPEHELRAREIIKEHSGLPVVCAHELSNSLGFQERTVTAILNAKLLPIIAELVESVKNVLTKLDILAPMMIVKSDGSLAGIDVIQERPIETILSGPSASIVGASGLLNLDQALILDMGGTTTDIALIKNKEPLINQEGAMVGGWRTRVKTTEVCTYGIGGDSYIQINPKQKKVTVGPKRVLPLCYAAHIHPHLINELEQVKNDTVALAIHQKTDCFLLLKGEKSIKNASPVEKEILDLLTGGPHSLFLLARQLHIDPNFFPFQNLVDAGAIGHISLTPTDILHVTRELDIWNREAALLGVELLAEQYDMDEKELTRTIIDETVNRMVTAIIQSLIIFEDKKYPIGHCLDNILGEKILKLKEKNLFRCSIEITDPLIGIGAPVHAWLTKVKEKLHMELIIPSHAEVANAYGAAIGKIIERSEIIIRPNGSIGGFGVYLPWEYTVFDELDRAKEYALASMIDWVKNNALKAGAHDPKVEYKIDDIYAKVLNADLFVETRITCSATGAPEAIIN
ncbi:hydantoinase/oxoprolinase family protein [Candidatus Formimonas warabiya]|uniref:Hydantoinase/oxoprolinase family protein n=1 Tax=Formimonas warabiya TaxID=1761012 RepID=A0A3G1L023_FORW1|nr:hydantoinase/oxoprolinase family protein [Candidatus Formimonas warabiya]ATW27991.1 hypothetical protein DCMF_27455 [Candidatus Formimonas warabiya]